MKKTKSKRLLTLVLVVVLVFALSVSAFATWSSFQGNNTNSGTISGQAPIDDTATVTPVSLPYNNPDYSVFTGVDAASVIQGNYAFTLYNGGVSGANGVGGARMQATNITNGATLWNIQLDTDASNDMQLSTPYYQSPDNKIYAAVTYTNVFQNYTSVSGWSVSGGASISSGTATFTAGNQTVSTSLTLTNPVNTIQVSSNLAVAGPNTETTYYAGYTVTLSNGNSTYTLVNNETASSAWAGTYATYNGAQIPAGTYTLTYTINSITSGATATFSTLTMSRYDWRLYSISKALSDDPNDPPTLSSVLASGEGQINTHINSIGGYLYFGGFGGEHSYYQYGPIDDENTNPSLTKFTPNTQEDFYYAGASKSSKNNTNYVVFGSESGKVYVRPVGATFGTATGSVINLAAMQSDCGPIRSSICVKNGVWYLTSRGSGSNGYLWKITNGTTANPTVVSRQLNGNTTSTPVVSDNNYVYVGYNLGYSSGGIVCVPSSFTSSTTLTTIYSGDPVQCSPLVYSDGVEEYVYFTTNSYSGAGYCYYWEAGVQSSIDEIWTAGGTSGNPYAVQGFSSEGGYLVYGDDGNYLYIVH